MYTEYVKNQDEALCHLYFHCCLKDGVMDKEELENVSAKLVAAGLNNNLNFKTQMINSTLTS